MTVRPAHPPRAVVFDLDGTLVDSMPMVMRAFHHALAPFLPPMTDAELFRRLGGPPLRMFEHTIGDSAKAAVAMQRMIDYAKTHWDLIQPFAGAHGLLGDLAASGRTLGIWTGRDRHSTQLILGEQALPGLREIICGDDLASHKPDPEGLRVILDRIGVAADETIYVGDADVDVIAGYELGVPTILIRHDREIAPDVARRAWRVVDQPEQAYALLRTAAA